MKNKKLALSVLSTAVISSMAASAFAAPKAGLYIGGEIDKYYSFDVIAQLTDDQFDTMIDEVIDNATDVVYVDVDGNAATLLDIAATVGAGGTWDEALGAPTVEDFNGNTYGEVQGDGSVGAPYDPTTDIEPVELEVESVKVLNLKQLEIKFNKEVTAATAEDETLYKENGGALAGATAALQSDKKTVIITFAAAKVANSYFSYQVAGVQDADGNAVTSDPYLVTFADTEKPTVKSTEYTGGKVVVTFSEPISAVPSAFRINGDPVTPVFAAGSDTVVEVNYTLAAGTSASLYIGGVEDLAGNEMDLFNGLVTAPEADTTAPSIVSVTPVGQDTVRFVFSEELDTVANDFIDSDITIVKGATTYDGLTYATVSQNLTVDPDGKTYDVTIDLNGATAGDGIFTGTSSTQALTFLVPASSYVDLAGNANTQELSQQVTLTKDTVAPAFVSAAVSSNKETFELTFDEDLLAGSIDQSKVLVTDADGVRYTVSSVTLKAGDDKTLVVDIDPLANPMAEGTYNISVSAGVATDKYGNATAAFNTSATVTAGTTAPDTTKPVATITNNGNNVFQVAFGEEVTSSALNLSNYKLDGVALPAGTEIYFTSTAKDTVEIVLPANSINFGQVGGGATAILTVSGVADKAGNVVDTTSDTVMVEDNTAAVLQTAEIVGDMMVLTFSENLDTSLPDTDADFVAANFEIMGGVTAFTYSAATDANVTVDGQKLYITFSSSNTSWQSIKGASTVTVETYSTGQTLTDANDLTVKGGVQVTATK